MLCYIVISVVTRILDFVFVELYLEQDGKEPEWKFILECCIFAYTIFINLGLMVPLGYQLIEQNKRLKKIEEIQRKRKRSFANSAASMIHRASIPLRVT